MRLAALAAVVVAAAAVAALALATDDDDERPRAVAPTATPTPTATPRRDVRRSRCRAGVPRCRAVRGTIVLVERVDPDGDGDLHVVIGDGSITAPGVTAVDVPPERRPRRDPRVGDRASAAGPVQTGSLGQAQIHALEFRVSG